VNFIFDAKGVIKVQPAVVKVLLEHLVKYNFLRLLFITLSATYQNDSGYFIISFQNHNLAGIKLNVEYMSYSSRAFPSFFIVWLFLKKDLKTDRFSLFSRKTFCKDRPKEVSISGR
jgi:hypothetical protein